MHRIRAITFAAILQSLCFSTLSHEELFIRDFVKDKQIIFDVGANTGSWTKMVLQYRPNAVVYAFEPNADLFAQTNSEFQGKNVHIFPYAIGNKNGKALFFDADYHLLGGLTKRKGITYEREYAVPVYTIDNFCNQHEIDHIHYLKIDTEGSELSVLKGAKKMLLSDAIDLIQFEYGGTYRDANITLRNVYSFLKKHGYKVGYFKGIKEGASDESFSFIHKWKRSLEDYALFNFHAVSQTYYKNFKRKK